MVSPTFLSQAFGAPWHAAGSCCGWACCHCCWAPPGDWCLRPGCCRRDAMRGWAVARRGSVMGLNGWAWWSVHNGWAQLDSPGNPTRHDMARRLSMVYPPPNRRCRKPPKRHRFQHKALASTPKCRYSVAPSACPTPKCSLRGRYFLQVNSRAAAATPPLPGT